jgi:hypothetical protein
MWFLHYVNPIIKLIFLIPVLERSSADNNALFCHNLREFSTIYVKPLIWLENEIFCGRFESIEHWVTETRALWVPRFCYMSSGLRLFRHLLLRVKMTGDDRYETTRDDGQKYERPAPCTTWEWSSKQTFIQLRLRSTRKQELIQCRLLFIKHAPRMNSFTCSACVFSSSLCFTKHCEPTRVCLINCWAPDLVCSDGKNYKDGNNCTVVHLAGSSFILDC